MRATAERVKNSDYDFFEQFMADGQLEAESQHQTGTRKEKLAGKQQAETSNHTGSCENTRAAPGAPVDDPGSSTDDELPFQVIQ